MREAHTTFENDLCATRIRSFYFFFENSWVRIANAARARKIVDDKVATRNHAPKNMCSLVDFLEESIKLSRLRQVT